MITIGIDTHKATLARCGVDELGRELAARTVANDRRGHARVHQWAQALGAERRFGIEGSGSFGAALAQTLLAAGEHVVEVPATLTDRERRHLRRRGKSDPADALAIARATVREPALPAVHRHASVDDLRLLVTARDELVHERTRVANRLHADRLVLAPGYSTRIPNLVAARHLAAAQRLLARSAEVRAERARARLCRLRAIDREIAALDMRITPLVQATGTRLPTLPGVGVLLAAKLLGETGDVHRFRSAAAFAALAGTAPVPGFLGPDPALPAEPRRQPPAQPRAPPDGPEPGPHAPSGPGIPRTPSGRRQDVDGGHALPQTPPRRRRLPNHAP